ncbi:MAG: hypothetical protein JWM68_2103 [Verrucomicrobiales bacterium]|nr:hypothetical protein [Verrucomicrobiales bacterium]
MEELRLLTFRPVSAAVHEHRKAFLLFGLVFTWLAGIGRYWDNPRAELWQSIGLGSVLYVFVMAFLLWIIIYPLKPQRWSYQNVLLFVTLTAPPALLYAIPVERFMPLKQAAEVNAWFLGIVAAWRVTLFYLFLHRTAGLKWGIVVVASLLPLALIIITLNALNLEHVVFDVMGGIRREDKSANDAAYGVVFLLSLLSVFASPVLLIAYVFCVYRAHCDTPAKTA